VTATVHNGAGDDRQPCREAAIARQRMAVGARHACRPTLARFGDGLLGVRQRGVDDHGRQDQGREHVHLGEANTKDELSNAFRRSECRARQYRLSE